MGSREPPWPAETALRPSRQTPIERRLSRRYDEWMQGRRPKIGVLALQGAFREHIAMLRRLGADAGEVRLPEQLDDLDALVIPGGESTTMTKLAALYGLDDAIRSFSRPILGTCAGMILLDRSHLGLIDIDVERNAYGRQVASFEGQVDLRDGLRAAARRLHSCAAGH